VKIGQTVVIFKMAADAILDFQKFEIFTVDLQCASTCQISSKSLKRFQRYGDLTVFKMAAVCHLELVKFKFLTVGEVKRPTLHQRNKFRKYRSNCCGEIAIFVISFQYGGRRHLGFSKILNFNG